MIYRCRIWSMVIVAFCILQNSVALLGHEIRPAYLEIKESGASEYTVLWKVPLLENRIPDIYPVFSVADQLIKTSESRTMVALSTFYKLNTDQPLGGSQVHIYNLERTLIDVLVRIERQSGEIQTMLLQPSSSSGVIPVRSSNWQVAKTFGILGVEHILFGWDHLLFVLGLLLLIRSWSILAITISTFTIAHSITLILSSLGHFVLPSAPVETVIALSVIFLGREYIMERRGQPSLTAQKPWLVALVFGLLHGFGFAGALSNIGLPQHALFTSLLSFNLGVEIGQLLFVIVLIMLYWIFQQLVHKKYQMALQIIPGYLIGGIASFWFLERLFDIVL